VGCYNSNGEIWANLICIAARNQITFISNRSGCFAAMHGWQKRIDERFGYGQGDFDQWWISFKVEMQTTWLPFWDPVFR
jgi:hypothetical protein